MFSFLLSLSYIILSPHPSFRESVCPSLVGPVLGRFYLLLWHDENSPQMMRRGRLRVVGNFVGRWHAIVKLAEMALMEIGPSSF